MKLSTKIALGTLGAVTCAILSGGLTYAALQHGLGSSETASWVQAVGSIAALGIAIYVMSRQNAHSAKLVADADRIATFRRAKSVAAVLLRAYEQIKAIDQKMRTPSAAGQDIEILRRSFQASLDLLNDMISSIKSIPVHDLGSYHMADGILQFDHSLSSYKLGLQFLVRDPAKAGQDIVIENLAPYTKLVEEALKKFNAGLDEIKTGIIHLL